MDISRTTYSDFAAAARPTAAEELSDSAWLKALLEFERALARAAADLGIVAAQDADDAESIIYSYDLDLEAVSIAAASGANPAIPIVGDLKAAAGEQGKSAAAIHLGATSQDAVDSAIVLVARRAARHTLEAVGDVEQLLRGLAETHRDTPMMGRTLGQQALPTTAGLVAAGWLQGVVQARRAFVDAVAGLPLQYAGPTGTLHKPAQPADAIALHDRLAELLELPNRPLVWHSDRQPIAALAAAAARLAGAVRKIAGDIIFLSATEVGEVREASPGGSSSMPHKANPAAAVACDGYARRTPALAATLLDALDHRLQRATGSWHAEWQTLRDLLAATDSAVNRIRASLDGLQLNTDAMAARVTSGDVGLAPTIVDDILERTSHP